MLHNTTVSWPFRAYWLVFCCYFRVTDTNYDCEMEYAIFITDWASVSLIRQRQLHDIICTFRYNRLIRFVCQFDDFVLFIFSENLHVLRINLPKNIANWYCAKFSFKFGFEPVYYRLLNKILGGWTHASLWIVYLNNLSHSKSDRQSSWSRS